jgi:hypothetical protein
MTLQHPTVLITASKTSNAPKAKHVIYFTFFNGLRCFFDPMVIVVESLFFQIIETKIFRIQSKKKEEYKPQPEWKDG